MNGKDSKDSEELFPVEMQMKKKSSFSADPHSDHNQSPIQI